METKEPKRRGKKPSGVIKDNVCVRLTAEAKEYLVKTGGGTSKGVDFLIDFHRKATSQSTPVSPATP